MCDFFLFHIESEGKCGWIIRGGGGGNSEGKCGWIIGGIVKENVGGLLGGGGPTGMLPPPLKLLGRGLAPPPPQIYLAEYGSVKDNVWF